MSELFDYSELKAPASIISDKTKISGWQMTEARNWTADEIRWAVEQHKLGHSKKTIAKALGRSEVSVRLKLNRQTKADNIYNTEKTNGADRQAKYQGNQELLEATEATSALDVYAGNSWWKDKVARTLTNDISEDFDTDHHQDAHQFLCWVTVEQQQYDIVDLDPFGSPYECLDLAMRIARKGLAVSFGDYGMKRWNRTDYVEPRYGISTIDEYQNGLPFIEEVQRIAKCNHKVAEPIRVIQYGNFLRAYFTLGELRVADEWRKPNAKSE